MQMLDLPTWFLTGVKRLFAQVDIDVCSWRSSAVGALVELRWPGCDGLREPWDVRGPGTRILCHPPHGPAADAWIERAAREAAGGGQLLLVLPADSEPGAWRDLILPHAAALAFPTTPLPFMAAEGVRLERPALVYFGPATARFRAAFDLHAAIVCLRPQCVASPDGPMEVMRTAVAGVVVRKLSR
jgi:hypothetical protein